MYKITESKGLYSSVDVGDLQGWLVYVQRNGLTSEKDTWVMQRKLLAQVGTSGVPKVELSLAVTGGGKELGGLGSTGIGAPGIGCSNLFCCKGRQNYQ